MPPPPPENEPHKRKRDLKDDGGQPAHLHQLINHEPEPSGRRLSVPVMSPGRFLDIEHITYLIHHSLICLAFFLFLFLLFLFFFFSLFSTSLPPINYPRMLVGGPILHIASILDRDG